MDWISGAALLLGSIASLWAIIQGRRKTQAETNGLVATAYKSLTNDLRDEIKSQDQVIRILQEENRNLKEERDLLHEQKVHAESFLAIITAKLAAYEGQDMTNSEAEDESR